MLRREIAALDGVVRGMSNREIADRLCVTEQTVKNQMTTVLRKLDADDRMQPASRLGLEAHHIADHHLRRVQLELPPEDGAHLGVVHADSVRRPVPLQHRAQDGRHHAPGARAIASSSAAFTS